MSTPNDGQAWGQHLARLRPRLVALAYEPRRVRRRPRAESMTMAMLVLMESMSPLERAAFVLCEVFGLSAPEAATALECSPVAVRQLTSRGRRRAREYAVQHPFDPVAHERVSSELLGALRAGDLTRVVGLLAPEVEMVADGGGWSPPRSDRCTGRTGWRGSCSVC